MNQPVLKPNPHKPSHFRQLRPFLMAAGLWALLGSGVVGAWERSSPNLPEAMGWWALLFILSCADLGAIVALVGALLLGPPAGDRVRWGVRIAFLISMKLGAWGIFAAILFGNHGIPHPSLLSGLGTLIVVPLLGGFLWSLLPSSEQD